MGVMIGPSYNEGVRIKPNNYHLPELNIDGRVSFNATTEGKNLHAGVDDEGLNIKVSDGNSSFGDWHPQRSLTLKGKKGLATEIEILTRTVEDVRGSLVNLNFQGDKFDPENWSRTGIMFQEKGNKDFETSDTSVNLEDQKGREWSIVLPGRFTREDVIKTMTQVVKDVEELLQDVQISDNPEIARDIIELLIGFGDDASNIMSKFEQTNK